MFASNEQPIERSMPLQSAQHWLRDEPNPRTSAVKVFVEQQAFLRINAHSRSDMHNEVGGWLAGSWCWDRDLQEEFIVVEGVIPAKAVRQGTTFITFTHDSQVEMHSVLEKRYPQKKVVGWYHTHPRMGLFLSEHDLWLHKQFFSQPWQVALVLEPHSCVGGFFIRDQFQKLDSQRYYGFYEILQEGAEPLSHWQNFVKEEALVTEEG
jgi:proteasome lid subunit RPN8/RPN11